MPQASPVGPAPTMTTSKDSTLQHSLHTCVDLGQSVIQRGCIFAAGFGHIGSSAAFAADRLSDGSCEFAGVNFGGQVLGHAADDRHVAILGGSEHDHRV